MAFLMRQTSNAVGWSQARCHGLHRQKGPALEDRHCDRRKRQQEDDGGDEQVIALFTSERIKKGGVHISADKPARMREVVDAGHDEPVDEHDQRPLLRLRVYVTAAALPAVVNEGAEQSENGGGGSDGQLCSAQQGKRREVHARRGTEQESA